MRKRRSDLSREEIEYLCNSSTYCGGSCNIVYSERVGCLFYGNISEFPKKWLNGKVDIDELIELYERKK
jgi:hypothetical protein